jgi:hypothetical protein
LGFFSIGIRPKPKYVVLSVVPSRILPQMGTLTMASFVGFKTEPQYLFVRALAFCDPWLQLADEPKIDNIFCCIFGP